MDAAGEGVGGVNNTQHGLVAPGDVRRAFHAVAHAAVAEHGGIVGILSLGRGQKSVDAVLAAAGGIIRGDLFKSVVYGRGGRFIAGNRHGGQFVGIFEQQGAAVVGIAALTQILHGDRHNGR